MSSLIGIGLTGLKAHQVALSTTGNNVTNANTEGYSRQEVIFNSASSVRTGAGYIGSGVNVETVRRVNQEYINTQLRSDTTVYNEQNALLKQASQIDNLLASDTTGLTPAMSSFFKAVQGGADNPSSVPERQLLLTQSEGLVSRFQALYSRLSQQQSSMEQEIAGNVADINSMSKSIAELNNAITVAIGSGGGDMPNSLLDERDQILRELSEIVSVSIVEQGDNRVNVFIGKGQPLVVGNEASRLITTQSAEDSTRTEVAFVGNGSNQIITTDITGGSLGGIIAFRDGVLRDSINAMGRVALVLSDTINHQHKVGMDLDSNLGGDFFTNINDTNLQRSRVFANEGNAIPADRVLGVEITDAAALTLDDYELQFNGPSNSEYLIVRRGSNDVVTQGTLPGFFPSSIKVEGFDINLTSGSFQVGDSFLIQPTRFGARDFGLSIDRLEEIAFASPVRTEANLGNIGSAAISQGEMLDVENPLTHQQLPLFSVTGQLSPPMAVRFINDHLYEVLDVSNPAAPKSLVPPLNNQTYIAGVKNQLFTKDPGETLVSANGPDIATLAAPGVAPFNNGYSAQNVTFLLRDPNTGVVTNQTIAIAANTSAQTTARNLSMVSGVEANAYTSAMVRNIDAADGLTLNGEVLTVSAPAVFSADELETLINNTAALQQQGIYAVSDGTNLTVKSSQGVDLVFETTAGSVDVDKISPYSGAVLASQTVNAGNGVAVGGFIDVTMANGVTLTADVAGAFQQAPAATSTYRGVLIDIAGEPEAGDQFSIDYNTGGTSDNRNALALAQLETKGTANSGVSTFHESYSELVETIGTYTNQIRMDKESSQALLQQSQGAWDEISGVNLDEEAGRLIQYQAAYNASAQVVSIARELFDTLLSTFR
ncbi:MAG: flagellar hook-associated protein FlgK [Hahellaceae bacterium]|nr:flagellar hook-associated protein FlgK [Hahellaceae bacterium]